VIESMVETSVITSEQAEKSQSYTSQAGRLSTWKANDAP